MPKRDPNYEFVLRANPHSWWLCATNLHNQAAQLQKQTGRSLLTQTDGEGRVRMSRDGNNKSVFLLGGFAMENAIKAFLVFGNRCWISNGAIASKLQSHSLISTLFPQHQSWSSALARSPGHLRSRIVAAASARPPRQQVLCSG
jgi:hypothetical protein